MSPGSFELEMKSIQDQMATLIKDIDHQQWVIITYFTAERRVIRFTLSVFSSSCVSFERKKIVFEENRYEAVVQKGDNMDRDKGSRIGLETHGWKRVNGTWSCAGLFAKVGSQGT